MDIKPLLQKASALINVTLFPILTKVRLEQYIKAPTPIEVTVYSTPSKETIFGISTLPVYLLGFFVTLAILSS